MADVAREAERLDIFISYSRRDSLDFADQLAKALEALGFRPIFDREDISGGEEWKARLGQMILEADTVVFVLSPQSAASPICAWEVEEAARLAKRILPVIAIPLGEGQAPERLDRLNFIHFCADPSVPGSGFGQGLMKLNLALRTDLGWLREHRALLQRAVTWDERGHDPDRLVRGSLLAEAERWVASRPATAPDITDLQRAYLQASREAEDEASQALRQQLDERERLVREKEAATGRERHALMRQRRLWKAVGGLMLCTIAGLVAVIYKEPLAELWFEQTTVRRFIADVVRPHVLTVEQERALASGGTFRECSSLSCPEMVVVPSGQFEMGSPDTEKLRKPDEGPTRSVTIPHSFAVGRYEVTWDEWKLCVEMHGCDGKPTGSAGYGEGRHPVINVSWDQAVEYVSWLSRVTGRHYRLLSEAEWEYAARARTKGPFSFPDESAICEYANSADRSAKERYSDWCGVGVCDDGEADIAEVGTYRSNQFGLQDMHGNVLEWVQDCYGPYASAPNGSTTTGAQDGQTCYRVVRGGAWYFPPADLRSARRFYYDRSIRNHYTGFRVARELLH